MDKNFNNINYSMYICLKNEIKVTHSYDKIKKKYIIEVYHKNKLIKKYNNNPVISKDLNEAVTKTWIFYAKKINNNKII